MSSNMGNRDERKDAIFTFLERNGIEPEARPEVGLIAFWPYDWPKFLLSGTVEAVEDNGGGYLDGFARIKEYGGHYFKPFFCLTPAKGAELKRLLSEMVGAYE